MPAATKKTARKSARRGSSENSSLPELPSIHDTISDVFIMESLRREDEFEDRLEGVTLARLLRLAGKNPKYHYFEDENELPYLIRLFRQSQYRYIHFSSHGSPTEVLLQNGSMTYQKFASYFKGHLQLRRAFFSSCSLGSEMFSEVMAGQNKGMHSIVAPAEPISFAHAAVIYQTLYVSLFVAESQQVKHEDIRLRLTALKNLYPVKMHFSSYKSSPNNNWVHEVI